MNIEYLKSRINATLEEFWSEFIEVVNNKHANLDQDLSAQINEYIESEEFRKEIEQSVEQQIKQIIHEKVADALSKSDLNKAINSEIKKHLSNIKQIS